MVVDDHIWEGIPAKGVLLQHLRFQGKTRKSLENAVQKPPPIGNQPPQNGKRSLEDRRKLRRYKRRYKVEWTNAWLKNFRRVAVRWDRSLR
jgi:hypothetical protein